MIEYDNHGTDTRCTCPHGMGPGARLYGVNTGPQWSRLSTTKDCPVHDTCQHYTEEDRASRPAWGTPWCPVHGRKACPE